MGTSAWGKTREGYDWANDDAKKRGSSHPVFAVLFDTCDAMVDAIYNVAKAAEDVRDDLHRIYRQAVVDSIKQLDPRHLDVTDAKSLVKGLWHVGKGLVADVSVGVVLNIDEGALNDAVSAYENRVHRQAAEINALLPALDEAYTSAPTFNAETARAEAFGARALTDFQKDPSTRFREMTSPITAFPSTSPIRKGWQARTSSTSTWERRTSNWSRGFATRPPYVGTVRSRRSPHRLSPT